MSYSHRVHVSELWSLAGTQKFSGVWENPSCFSYQETNMDVVLLKRRKKNFHFMMRYFKVGLCFVLTHGFRDFGPWQIDSVDWVCGGKTTAQERGMKFSLYLCIESYTIREGIFQKRFLTTQKYFSSWDAALWPLAPPLNSTLAVRTPKPCGWSLPRSIHSWDLGNVFC